jgi:hypothetical protein
VQIQEFLKELDGDFLKVIKFGFFLAKKKSLASAVTEIH